MNSSNLPNSIPIDNTHLAWSDKGWNVPVGPIIGPIPGPTFEIDVAAPERDVIVSAPVKRRRNAIPAKDKMYRHTKPITDIGTSSVIA